MTVLLNAAEQNQLSELEAVIERGMRTFIEVGGALYSIRDQRLYRAAFDTFEAYCQDRWGFSDSRARQLIGAAQTVTTVTAAGLAAPSSERQARELSRVPEAERAEVWRETVERTGGHPTAAAVRETYAAVRPAPQPDPFDGSDWLEPDDTAIPGQSHVLDHTGLETVAPTVTRRRPLPEAFADAGRDLTRAAEKLTRLTEDDRFGRNRDQTHHQMPELLGALEHTARLITAMNLPAADASEEARRWWATSLHKISDALTDVANTLN